MIVAVTAVWGAAGLSGSPLTTKALWYLTRGTGAVSLVLLTAVVVLGVANSVRWHSPRLPRFVVQGVHRNVSLLVVLFIALHVATSIVDGFAPIGWLDAVVPFASPYRPIWLGLGAVAFDLLIALVVTSLLRVRFGQRSWRVVHWLAYACWPVALIHGLGTGTDTAQPWMLALTGACVLAVLATVGWRLASGHPAWTVARRSAAAATLLGLMAVSAWLVLGPLRPGWARAAGTPASLLRGTAATASSAGGPSPAGAAPGGSGTAGEGRLPSEAAFDGTLHQSTPGQGGQVTVDIRGRTTGSQRLRVRIRLTGSSDGGGGLAISDGTITVGTDAMPADFSGPLGGVEDGRLVATLTDAAGSRVQVVVDVRVGRSDRATGHILFRSVGANGGGA